MQPLINVLSLGGRPGEYIKKYLISYSRVRDSQFSLVLLPAYYRESV